MARKRDFSRSFEKTELSCAESGIWGGGAGGEVLVGRGYGLGEGETRGAQQEEEFAGPEQNVQQAAALKIGQALGMQADVEGLSRAFFDEGAHGRQVHGFGGAELAAPRIKAFELFITARQEVAQAKSLVIQCSNRGPAARTHPAVSIRKHRIHPTQVHGLKSTNGFIPLQVFLNKMRYATQTVSSSDWNLCATEHSLLGFASCRVVCA